MLAFVLRLLLVCVLALSATAAAAPKVSACAEACSDDRQDGTCAPTCNDCACCVGGPLVALEAPPTGVVLAVAEASPRAAAPPTVARAGHAEDIRHVPKPGRQ